MKKSFPITKTQLGIYFSESKAVGNSDYNICLLYRLGADVDIDRLREAVAMVLNSHPYVCSSIEHTDDGGICIVPPAKAQTAGSAVREYKDREALKAEMQRRFDIFSEPLFRFGLCRTAEGNIFGLCFHHIVFDGVSFTVFKEDLGKAYNGEKLELEQTDSFILAVQEEKSRGSQEFADAKEWYAGEFGAATDAATAPIPDVSDETVPEDTQWKSVTFPMDVQYEAVSSFSKENGVGISIPFTVAFGYTLSNFTGDSGALFATIHHGRNGSETSRTLGMMVKTFPVYQNFREDRNIAELLKQTSEQIRGARSRALYSFGDCCTDLSLTPQICFAFQGKLYDYRIELGGRLQETEDIRSCRPGYAILVNVFQDADGSFKCMMQYSARQYSDGNIGEFARTFDNVLSGLLISENVSQIELCDAEQTDEIAAFCRTPEKADENDTVVSLLRACAKAWPDNTAVIFRDRRLTYRELDERSDRLAAEIADRIEGQQNRELGIPVVSIMQGRSENFPIYTLAAMKAGAAYQPLDPSYPKERLDFMVKDSGASLLIVDSDLKELVSFDGEVMLTDPDAGIAGDMKSFGGHVVKPSDAAVLLYTSGSTGTPKGVVIGHHNLVTFCYWYRRYYSLNPGDCVAAYASFGFDADMMDLYAPLTTGAACAIVPEDIRLDFDALNAYFASCGVTHSFITTQVGYQFATLFPEHPTLRHLSIGGEKLASINPPTGYKFYNVYGPTECTVFSTVYPVLKSEPNIPIGKPLDTLNCRIVNRFGRNLPVGAAGELIIIGEQVSHGYLNSPEKTAGVFGVYGEKSYRSGDVVRYRADGNIEFVGRNDGQVKIRGFRIELKEVEAVIRQFDGIKDVTVQAFDLASGGKFIAAYVVSDGNIDIAALNKFILSQKPPYMVPAVTMQIDAIPLNVNQKVDRKKLPEPVAPVAGASDTVQDNREPNVLEKRLQEMTAGLVGSEVGLSVPLAYCGLSSILSMRLAAQIYKEFGVKIGSSELLSGISITDVENVILEFLLNRGNEPSGNAENAGETISSGISRLSFSQQGVYADCLAHPDSTIYNIPMEVRFPASVTAEALKKAVESVLEAHPILFAKFQADEDGEIVQVVPKTRKAEIPVVLTDNADEEKQRFVRPFNLENDTLWRGEIMASDACGPVLLLDIHHLVCDGGSYDIIFRELVTLLGGGSVSDERYTYLNFCRDQKSFAASDSFKEHKEFFAGQLRDYENVTEIASDISSEGPGRQAEVAMELPQRLLDWHSGDVTAAGFWLAAAAYTIGRYANAPDVYISTVSSGRQNLDIESTVGMFVNTLPVCIRQGKGSVKEYIAAAAEVLRGTVAHENYPFSIIAADYGYSAAITYAYQLGIISDAEIGGEKVGFGSFGLTEPKFKIGVFIEVYGGKPSLVIQYDDSLYSRGLMQSLADSIVTAAINMTDNGSAPMRSVSILSDGQKEVLKPFHKVADSVSTVGTFHDGIARWARETPDAVAVVASDRTLTYREFDREACRMARALAERGLAKGDRVVLLLPRTSDFLVAVYAVMKSGAAYIPMDPEYPAERIAFILENSEGRFVLTTSDKVGDYADRALDMENVRKAAASCSPEPLNIDVTPDDLAYLIYTSGSTGTPKGVMLQHRGIVNYLTPHPANPHTYAVATRSSGVVCSATVSFDLSILEYGTALFNGKMLVFADEKTTTDSLALAELYRKTGADVLSGTPSRIDTYMEMQEYRDVIRDCKVIQMGGEKLPTSLMKRLQAMTDAEIYNMYGPTEITICCNAARLNGCDTVSVGSPLPGFTEYIIDSDGNELPAGVMGELLISGVGVCPGYYNLPDKTAAAFIGWNGTRAYKSGDYAKWTDNGQVMILGRTDSQVKLNGLRIELGEIETVMGEQSGVHQCVVAIRKVGQQDKLVAWFTADGPCTPDSIREGMSERLTPYMVPNILMELKEMPVSPSGKIDMKKLPEPTVAERGYVAPKNSLEKFFCDAIAQVLKLEKVGAKDNFFEIGGTSLVAMRLSVAISRGGYRLAYKDIFDNPTPAAMAAFVNGGAVIPNGLPEDDTEISGYDYGRFADIVSRNNSSTYFKDTSARPLGTVLLTGATGYLGVHVLRELLEDKSVPAVWCLVRGQKNASAMTRIQTMLFYYFNDICQEEVGKRLFAFEGDVTKPIELGDIHIDTVINCAANVKHFSAGTDIEDINIGGALNCIDLCLRTGATFIHTSTGSVSGVTLSDNPHPMPHILLENELYFGQVLDNKYLRSKFLAERAILEAVAEKGLKAKIMRLGNLAPRSSDGEFQVNFHSNSFMGRLKAYQTLGAIPYSALMAKTEFSPIDETARAICLLAGTNSDCVIFNVFNPHRALYLDLVDCMNRMGHRIRAVGGNEFERILQEALKDPKNADILQSMLAYTSRSDGKTAVFNSYASDYTTQVLYHLGFQWNTTTWDYMEQFLTQIQALEFFDDDYNR